MRYLIINADDYGYSKIFNRGIVDGINGGGLTSVTVLVNNPFVDSQLASYPNISVGLHFELKQEENAQKALLSQIEKFQSIFDKLPSHIDGHKGAYSDSNNRETVIQLALELNLPIRAGNAEQRTEFKAKGIKTTDHFLSSLNKTPEQVLFELSNIPDGVTEWMVHPGYFDLDCKSSLNKEREKELGIILSQELQNLLKTEKISLANFYQLHRLV